ncbi:MAG: glutamine--fructose-6-phosphate transaminase (isomerizing), partial [Burkholderiales bacterium]
ADGRAVHRPSSARPPSHRAVELGSHRHYMQKEIHEQPAAVASALEAAAGGACPQIFGVDAEAILRDTRGILILACGTSLHAGMVARYWLEGIAGIPCTVEIASEYRYREPACDPDTLVVAVSQSGETADTLAALQYAKAVGHRHSLAICNVPESALVRTAELRFLTRAGPEIGVASTKSFTTQLVALLLLAVVLARLRGRLTREREAQILGALRGLPGALAEALALESPLEGWARKIAQREHALFLGRGIHFPVALEGALKLKEISYIHAEGYAAGELKHGPLALIDAGMPVIALSPNDALRDKLASNLHEIRARDGQLYVLADAALGMAPAPGFDVIQLPACAGPLSPIVRSVPLQLLAYHAALARGNDVDKPRNLAKSVTVE